MYLARESSRGPMLRTLVVLIVAVVAVYWVGSGLLAMLGGGTVDRAAAVLRTEDRGTTRISLDGAAAQTAENGMNVFPGDAISTAAATRASLRFFDGTWTRLDEQSELSIEESDQSEDGTIVLGLQTGSLWITVPDASSRTGSVLHVVRAEGIRFDLPPGTEALLSPTSLAVFSNEGAGVEVTMTGEDPFLISEGQQWEKSTTGDVFANRMPLQQDVMTLPFVRDSRSMAGSTGTDVTAGASSSSQPVATPPPPVAAGALGNPTITSPAKDGQTFTTTATEIVLRGTSPRGAVGMMVNEYKLQLFNPDKGEWSYLASIELGNMKPGENTYDVRALGNGGETSDPVRLTIVHGTSASTTSARPTVDIGSLPTNAPLTPGVLSVTAPTAGTSHTETGTGFLLEGKTSADTTSVWVNDYQLQLYTAGKTTWNYIASLAYQNLKPGPNVYRIVARNAEGQILDRMEYTVELRR